MKITIYTIKDCAFSKQEKEYLNTNKLVFEEKDLETNKEFLTEMLAISNNFAGTPVTRVEKDDGTIAVLKGFTKEEFDTTFGLSAVPVSTDSATPPVAQPTSPAEVLTEAGSTDSTVSDPLKSVMDDLQAKADPVAPPAPETPVSEQPISPPVQPISTDSTDSTAPPVNPAAPTIPDFPAK